MENEKGILIITGCEGFIGSNIAKFFLSNDPKFSIIGCGSLNKKEKLLNINSLGLVDFWNKEELFQNLDKLNHSNILGIIHMGACSSTDEWDGKYLIENNTRFSNRLIDFCYLHQIRLIHASSASVYGLRGEVDMNNPKNLSPINMYAYSKMLTDNYLAYKYPKQKVITSLRFFNVYGLNENHKVGMSSPVHGFNQEAKVMSEIRIFKEQDYKKLFTRDFISVEDIVELISKIFYRNDFYGVYDVGTNYPISFRKVAEEIKRWWEKNGKSVAIREVDFPDKLIGSYQSYTCADMSYLEKKDLNWKPRDPIYRIQEFLNKINSNIDKKSTD